MKKLGVVVFLIGAIGILMAMTCGCSQGEGPVVFTKLRAEYKTLDENEAKSMIKSHRFFDKRWNKYQSFSNQFELQAIEDHKIVIDHATSLAWHQSGSELPMPYTEAKLWIENLNKKGYAGYYNWRLPTLEEAASLIEQKKTNYRYIDPVFSNQQHSLHTGDIYNETRLWGVSFQYGGCFRVGVIEPNYVRPVTKYVKK